MIDTEVPGAPRKAFRVSGMVQPFADFPATSTIRSPVSIPARSAGVPGSAETTITQSSRTSI
jgi:hypothetical protein